MTLPERLMALVLGVSLIVVIVVNRRLLDGVLLADMVTGVCLKVAVSRQRKRRWRRRD